MHDNPRYVRSDVMLEHVRSIPRFTPVLVDRVGIKMREREIGAWLPRDEVVAAIERVAAEYGVKP